MPRSIIDTEAELDARATALTRILSHGDWSSAFVRHHIKKMVVEAQNAAGERAAANLAEAMQREWVAAEPLPASNQRLLAAE